MKYKLVIALGLVSVLALSIIGAGNYQEPTGYIVGSKVNDFSLKNIDGNMVKLSQVMGKNGAIVVFTCNTCPYANYYEQRIIDLDKNYRPKGFPIIAINPNDVTQEPGDSFEEMVKRAKEKNYSFPYLHDINQIVAKTFGASRTPHIYIVSNTESPTVKYIGAIDDNHKDAKQVTKKYVESALEALLAKKEVELTNTKAIGCTIKWKE